MRTKTTLRLAWLAIALTWVLFAAKLGAFSGFLATPQFAIASLTATPTEGEPPLVTSYVVLVDSLDGRPLEDVTLDLVCDNGAVISSPPEIELDMVDADTGRYEFTNVCTSVAEGTRVVEVRLRWKSADLNIPATTTITVTPNEEPEGVVDIYLAQPDEPTCTIPCETQAITALAINYDADASVVWKADLNADCPDALTACDHVCWETPLVDAGGVKAFLVSAPVAVPQTVGVQQIRMCVLDGRPSSGHTSILFTAESAVSELACTAAAVVAGGGAALETNCTGGTSAEGCDLTHDCDKATSGSSSTLYNNSFATTGAPGCDDVEISGGATCTGGTGTIPPGGNLKHTNGYVSATEQFILLDDIVITDGTVNNESRISFLDGTTFKYSLRTENRDINSMRIQCPEGSAVTSGGPMYTDGVPTDLTLHFQNTATGLFKLRDATGAVRATCNGVREGKVSSYSIGPGTGSVTIGAYVVTQSGGGSVDPSPVADNTTWPYNTFTAEAEVCPTTSAVTGEVTIACPNSEVVAIDVPIAGPPFKIDSITLNTGNACTIPNCAVNEITVGYSGGTGTVSGLGCTLNNGSVPAVLTTTTDTTSPFSLNAEGGWAGTIYTQPNSYSINCSGTRNGNQASLGVQLIVSPQPSPTGLLQMNPSTIVRNITPGTTPSSDVFSVTMSDGSAKDFSCIEKPPDPLKHLETCCGTTPAQIPLHYANYPSSGNHCTDIECTRDDAPSDSETRQVCVNVAAPTGQPSWSAGLVNGKLAVNSGTSLGIVDFEVNANNRNDIRWRSGACPTLGSCVPCDLIYYDSVADGYGGKPLGSCRTTASCPAETPTGNPDVVAQSGDYGMRNILFKNVILKNGWKHLVAAHVDVVQFDQTTDYGGWNVLQDSIVRNSDDQHMIAGNLNNNGIGNSNSTACQTGGNMGGIIFQNVLFEQEAAFTTDCLARRTNGYASPTDPCPSPTQVQAANPIPAWFINVQLTNMPNILVHEGISRAIVVGPDPTGGNWGGRFNGVHVHYATIEAALAAGETRPPFINLSCSGWGTPPAGCLNVALSYPSWSAGRDAQGRLLVNTGKIRQSPTVTIQTDHEVASGTSKSELHTTGLPTIGIANSVVVRNSKFDNNYAADPLGNNIGNDKDTFRVAYANTGDQMKYLLVKSVLIENAQFNFTGPHADNVQIIGHETGTSGHYLAEAIVFQNTIVRNSDSGQNMWNTTMLDEAGKDFKFFVLQDTYHESQAQYEAECNTRTGGGRDCDGVRINIPSGGAGTHDAWLINVNGDSNLHFEGGDVDTPRDEPLIVVGVDHTFYGVWAGGTPHKYFYATNEAALADTTCTDCPHPEPPFIRLSCGGWANPTVEAPGCISGYGYVQSN